MLDEDELYMKIVAIDEIYNSKHSSRAPPNLRWKWQRRNQGG
jgi:hypothetical protein